MAGRASAKDAERQTLARQHVITIDYASPDPAFAALVGHTFAQAYIDTKIGIVGRAGRAICQMVRKGARICATGLEVAQTRLSKYQQEKGIVASDERLGQ